MSWIPKEKMVLGGKYMCIARHFDIGIWNGKEFEYIREGQPGTELHWDDGEPGGTVKPYVLMTIESVPA